PADAAILSSAIRRGQAERLPSLTKVAATFGVAAVFALVFAFVYQGLQNWRPDAALALPNGQLGDQSAVTLGSRGPTTWGIQDAYARGVSALGLGTGQVAIDLPLSRALCSSVADALQQRIATARAQLGSCHDGVLTVGEPLSVSWTHTEIMTALDGSGRYST